jgi:hypothetical protein
VAEQHQNVNVTLTELSRREQNGLLQVNVAAASTQRGDNKLQYLFYWYDEAGQEVASDGRGWTPQAAWLPDPHPVRPGTEPGRPGLPDLRTRSD